MLSLWYSRCPAPTAASIAIREGWLEQEFAPDGITVKSIAEAPDEPTRLAHYSHEHPALFRFGGYVPPLLAQSRGADLKVIGMNWHDRVSGFFALPESALQAGRTPRGMRIALPVRRNDKTDWWRATVLAGIEALCAPYGLGITDLHIVPIEIERTYYDDATVGEGARTSLWGSRSQFAVQREEVGALYRGEVDLIYSDAALAAILMATTGARPAFPLHGLEDDSLGGFGHPIVLTVSAHLLAERPDLVDRWMSRLLDAQDWASRHVSQVRRIFANDTGLPEALLDQGYSSRLISQVDVSLAESRISLLRSKFSLLLRHGFIGEAYEFDAMFDDGPLTRAGRLRAA
jgi:ABC-type nitrate/sulfonate/bicarbonate transport system substrate-binding protein